MWGRGRGSGTECGAVEEDERDGLGCVAARGDD